MQIVSHIAVFEGGEHDEREPKQWENSEKPVLFAHDISDQRAYHDGYFPKSNNVHFVRRLLQHRGFRVTTNAFGCATEVRAEPS